MQINMNFSGRAGKRIEDTVKTGTFSSNKFDYKEGRDLALSGGSSPSDFKQRQGKKKDSAAESGFSKPSGQITFGPRVKSPLAQKTQEEDFEDEKDRQFKQLLMSLGLPTEYPNYSSVDYWNNRYSMEKGEITEWLIPFESFRSMVVNLLRRDYGKEIMVVGCGNSRLSEHLYNEGYRNITNIDFSKVLIEEMNHRYAEKEEMEFTCMDVCELEYPENCFDLIIDKGTFDCVLCGEGSFERTASMINGVYTSLKKDGSFVLVSHGSPETRVGYLQVKGLYWNVRVMEIEKAKLEKLKNLDEESQFYIYLCTKY